MLGHSNRTAGMDETAASPSVAARKALADAVGKHKATELTLSKLSAALETAKGDRIDALVAIERTQETLRKAREIDGDAVVAAVLADAPVAPRASQRAAREALAAAEETAEQARALAGVLESKIEETKRSLNLQAMTVQSAVTACLQACSARTIAEFVVQTEALQAQLLMRMTALQLLVGQGILDDTPAQDIGRFFIYEPRHWKVDTSNQAEIATRWRAMIDRLGKDANAPAELR
jgi:hypothetical protein